MNQGLPKPLQEALARQRAGDDHPSPDLLTAFVERSLPHRESQRITDHLAKCADCREVVFLASSAVEEPVGEEQEWMPAAAVLRISPALQAKASIPRTTARVDPGTGPVEEPAPVPATPGRRWMLRWAWVPAIATIVLVTAFLIERSEFGQRATQSPMTIVSKGQQPAVTNSPQTSPVAPEPESEAELALQNAQAKSALAQGKSAQTSDSLALAPLGSVAQQSSSASAAKGTPKPPTTPKAVDEAYTSLPGAIPRQNSFVEGEGQNPSGLVAGSQLAPGKNTMGLLPAIATRRQWRISPDGHVEHSTVPGNWTLVLADQPATFHVVSVIADNVWAGGAGGVLFHSNDGGRTWSKVVVSSPDAIETGTIVSIRFSDEQHGVITTGAGLRWSTSDDGITWTKE